MKKLYLLMLALLSCIVSANAQDFNVDGVWYSINWEGDATTPGEVTVTKSPDESGYTGPITIDNQVTYSKTYNVRSIQSNAFKGCTGLTSVTINCTNVTSIDWEQFKGCTGLTSVTIPNSVTSIGSNAFEGCTSLTSITIPNSVTFMSNSVFYGCNKLETVELSNQLERIEWGTFQDCTSLKSVTIPNSVTNTGGQIFQGCSNLTNVVLSNKLERIDNNTFRDCTSLSSIEIPTSVKVIGGDAFYGCSKLTKVIFSGDKLTTIEGSAFRDCTSLSEITVPNTVTSIGNDAFCGCTSLTSVNIPDGVTKIESSTFANCTSLPEITIPSTITIIGGSAFSGCTSLTSITIPNSVTTIGEKYNGGAFSGCTGLKTVEIPNSVTYIGDNSFSGCTSLSEITIPSSVTNLGDCAFSECTGIKVVKSEIATPLAVSSSVFGWWNNQAMLVVPEGSRAAYKAAEVWKEFAVTFEDGETIYAMEQTDDQGLNYTLKQTNDNIYYAITGHSEDMKSEIVIPANYKGCPVKAIVEGVFNNCTSLKSITFESDVTLRDPNNPYYYNNAFYGCSSLDEVIVYVWDDAEFCNNHILGELQNPIDYYDNVKNESVRKNFDLHIIKKDSEGYEYEITEFIIPDGVTTIGDGAFKGFTNLYSISIPNSVTSIGRDAFRNCDNLASVKMGKNVSSIGDHAFFNCASLNSIVLPKKLESIDDYAFSGDDASIWSDRNRYVPISSIVIPGNVSTIGKGAFLGCRNLALISFDVNEDGLNSLTSIGDDAFSHTILTSITLPKGVTTIGKRAFEYDQKLTTVSLGEALTEIGEETFYGCNALTSVTIPDGVTSIGERAFQDCYNLTAVKIPTALTSMGENAFKGCQLKSIELPNSFTAIPANLFQYNDFEYIKLGNNVKSIGKNAFGCALMGDEAQVVIEIGTSTPPSISNEAFPNLSGLLSVINVIVPDATAESAYSKAAVWKEMTYANLNTDVEVTVAAENVGKLSTALVKQTGMMPAKVVGLKVKGTINEEDFNQMRKNFKALLRLDLSECDITTIPDLAMKGKTQLQEVTLPTSLQTIGRSAFQGCSYLTGKLDLPSGVTSIGNSAFEGTYYTSVTLPKSLKSIGDSAFYNLPIKQKLMFPESMSNIGKYAFADTKVYDPILFPHSIDELGDGAFRNTQISGVALPSKITSLNWGVFQGCTNLSGIVDVLVNYTEVAGYAFDGCTSLTHLRLSPNLTRMGEYAFQNTSVEYVNIPSRIKIIARGVFKNCKKLESLALPANLEKLSEEALYGCSGLRNLSVEAITPPAAEGSSMIGVNTDLCIISIPTDSYEDYLLADYWGQFVNQRNDIAVTTEGNGEIAFESVEGGEEEEAQARARARQLMSARARTRGTTEAEPEVIYINSGSSVYVPKDDNENGKVRFYIIPGEGATLEWATLDGVDITNEIVGGIYTATADKRNGKLVVKFSGEAEKEVITTPVKIGGKGKTTLTSSEALDFSDFTDLKAYVATGYEGNGTVWLTRITQVPANTPVLVKGVANEIYNVPVMDKCDAYYENLFVGSAEEDINIWSTSYENNMSYRNYYMAGGVFKPVSDQGQNIKAGKCYLRVPYWFDGNYTGDSQTFTMSKSGKSSYTPPVAIDVTDLEAQGLKAYTATGYDAATSTIWLTRINKIPAGTGVILKGDKEKTYTLPSVNVEAYYGNMFIGNTYGTITINETSDDGEWTNFYLASGSFKKVNGTREIGDFKSYLHLPTSLLVSGTRGKSSAIADEWSMEELETEIMILGSIGGDDEDGTTKIDAIGNESAQPDVYYNLQGQRVDNPGKGVYIRNGKKVIIK